MLGEFLRIARIANDKKIIDVAEETGISKSYLTEIEKGIKKPSDDILQKICINYNIESHLLLTFAKYSEDANLNYRQILLLILEYYEYEKINNYDSSIKK